LYAIDAAPTLASAYAECFSHARVACEPAEESNFFGETFDGVMAWGLLFLLSAEAQSGLIYRISHVLRARGRFLFTVPTQLCTWNDATTGRQSLSLGDQTYRSIFAEAGLTLLAEYGDEGENHYYDVLKP